MQKTEEQKILSFYIGRLMHSHLSKIQQNGLIGWIDSNKQDLAEYSKLCKFDELVKDSDTTKYRCRAIRTTYEPIVSIKELKTIFPKQPEPKTAVFHRIALIKKVFKLTDTEANFLTILALTTTCELFDDLTFEVFGRNAFLNKKGVRCLATIMNCTLQQAEKIFAPNNTLFTKGLIENTADEITESKQLSKLFISDIKTEQDIRSMILEETATAKLSQNDFSYIKADFDFITKLLSNALKQRQSGVNIILYGEPGTGKTELAKTICHNIGANLYLLSENKADSYRDNRVSELCITKTLLDDDPQNVILMDEAEDIFYTTQWDKSKIFFNRLLEKNKTPIIWITNNIHYIDPAFIRRFSFALEMKKPPQTARENIWRKLSQNNNISLTKQEITNLAKKYAVAPSFIETALRSATLTNDKTAITKTIDNLEKALGQKSHTKHTNNLFNPKLLHTDTDLIHLTEQIKQKGTKRFSMCLYGVSGTGKSAFAYYMAERLGMSIIHKKASDLFGSYVGQTERNIANTFKEATDNESILVIDEADSFLGNRMYTHQSWEISCVNEMLCQMEHFEYPFICTTNLLDKIDNAALRRFSFKVKYDFLTPKQVIIAFQTFFDKTLEIVRIEHLTNLAPGDFVTVKNQVDILGIDDTNTIISMLEKEQNTKQIKSTQRQIGFK